MGYRDNGTTVRAAEGRRVEQINLTLLRSGWHRPPQGCHVTGLTPAAGEMLGLPPA